MSMYDNIYTHYYYEVACGNTWVRQDAAQCGCRGKGWWLSEVDTWHQCPCHGQGVPHPEEYTEEEQAEMAAAPTPAPAPVAEARADEDDLPF